MSEDTHAHHVLRAQAIHNDTKADLERAKEILRRFHDHYPSGVNPFLDDAYADAGEFLRKT